MQIKTNERKILQLGLSLYVCIPMTWVKNHNLKKGSVVTPVILNDGNLLIKPCEQITPPNYPNSVLQSLPKELQALYEFMRNEELKNANK